MYKKLNIGILFNENQTLSDGHIKLLYDLTKSNKYEIKFVFKIGNIRKNNFLNDLFLKIIFFFEKKYLRIQRIKEQKIIKKKLSKLMDFNNTYLSKNSLKKLDLLLCFDKNIIKKKYNNSFINNEIWVVDYGCNDYYYAGFWQCFLNKEVTPVYLNRIIKKKNNFYTVNIDKGFYSTKQSSWLLNRDFIIEKSNSLILKNLRLFNSKINGKKISSAKDFNNPDFFILFNYILKKYPKVFLRTLSKILFKIFRLNLFYNSNLNPWNLHIGSYKGEKKN